MTKLQAPTRAKIVARIRHPYGTKSVRKSFAGVGLLLRGAWRDLSRVGPQAVAYAFVWSLLISAIGGHVISWLFRRVLHSDGMVAVDLATIKLSSSTWLSFVILIILAIVAFALFLMQVASVFYVLEGGWEAKPHTLNEVLGRVWGVLRKVVQPSSYPIFLYVFLLLPASGLGFASVLTQGIAVPNFITGELLKDPTTSLLWHGLMLIVLWINIRWSAALPLFVLTKATGVQAVRQSWKVTRGWGWVNTVLSSMVILIPSALITGLLPLIFVIPTWISDRVALGASPYVAAMSIGFAQVVALLWLAVVSVALYSVLAQVAWPAYVKLRSASDAASQEQLDKEVDEALEDEVAEAEEETVLPLTSAETSDAWVEGVHNREHALAIHWSKVIGVVTLVTAIPLGLISIPSIKGLVLEPDTYVIAHRGWVDGGVENSVEALQAASDVGADRVEMDIMQTADKKFVVIHDPALKRLASMNKRVKDMTLEELTQVQIHDEHGHVSTIPSLEEYITAAKEANMPLLMEVKMGGLDTEDHVDLLVEELEALDGLKGNWFHTLDPASVTRLKELLPDMPVGYIMPFAGSGLPNTEADFLVLEEYTASVEMQDMAKDADLGFFVWTVDAPDAQRLRFRQGVESIITDHPDTALTSRARMGEQVGYAPALLDLLENMLPN